MDQPISPRTLSLRQRSRWLAGVAIAAALFVLAWTLNRWLTPGVAIEELRLSEVREGAIANTISAAGVVIPVHEETLSSPLQSRVLRVLAKPGQQVAAGELLLELDDSTLQLAIESLHEQIAQQDNRIEGLSLDARQRQKQIASEIELLSLDLQRNQVQLERYRTLGALGATSASDLSAAELAVTRAQIQLRQYRESIADLQRSTASAIEGARLQKSIYQKQLQQQLALQQQTRVRAPFAGMLSWLASEEGSSVANGQMVAKVSELDNFRVEAAVSDFYARYLAAGQPARVEFSGQTLVGEVQMILPEIQNGTIKLLIDLAQPNHPLLRNKLRVETSIITEQKGSALVADNGPAFSGSGRQDIYVLDGERAIRTRVDVGLADGQQVEIVAGARLGDRLVVSDLSRFKHLDSIRVFD